MKKTITKLAIALSIATSLNTQAQTTVTFDTFTLATDTFYQDAASTDFSFGDATFKYDYSSFGYWSGGTSYTNKKDTIFTAQTVAPYYANLYSCIPGVAFSGTKYATSKSGAVITFSNNTTAVNGFYVTNTTYAWKAIKSGNMFSRRFGDTTGTGSGTSIPQGQYPDWFKLSVLGYRNGIELTDTVNFYLADYTAPGTANDYVIKNWQYVNCTALGQVDSIKFEMTSSDVGDFGINTPTYFSMDNFVTQSTVGLEELTNVSNTKLFPNPTAKDLFLNIESKTQSQLHIHMFDVAGKELQNNTIQTSIGNNQHQINTENLEAGIYFIEITDGNSSKRLKFIKL